MQEALTGDQDGKTKILHTLIQNIFVLLAEQGNVYHMPGGKQPAVTVLMLSRSNRWYMP